MNVHKNARLTPHSRAVLVHRVMVEGGRIRQNPSLGGLRKRRSLFFWLLDKVTATRETSCSKAPLPQHRTLAP
jgi:hypothetical protein